MTSLPERLRSLAKQERVKWHDEPTATALEEAADELDRRAERIQRLTTGINSMRLRGEMALKNEEQPPFDPETPGFPKGFVWDEQEGRPVYKGDTPGVTLTEDPTKPPRIVPDEFAPEDFLFAPGEWTVFCHPDGTVTLRRG